jgi:predicted metal-binding membrane protein
VVEAPRRICALTIAGAFQFTRAKARSLACYREAPERLAADAMTAWRHGQWLGLHCAACCANLTAILLAVGMMDLRAMVAVTAAITAERSMPAGQRVAQAIGAATVVVGLFLTAQALAI